MSFLRSLPFPARLALLFFAGVLIMQVGQKISWIFPWLALALWSVALIGLLHSMGYIRLPRGFIMDILDRLTNKSTLEGLMENKINPSTRSIDAAVLETELNAKVYGQAAVCRDVASQIKTRFAKTKRTKPVGVFMLAGPPATGKTWFAKVLSEGLYGENSLFLIEMSQYSQGHMASSLFGQAKGYAGSDSYGILTGALRNKPDRVILLDEIEKASRDVHTKFLSAWNDGFITETSTGEKIPTTDAIFILTTNAAQREIATLKDQYANDRDGYSDACKNALKDHFAPEVLSRIDRVFPFLPLEGMDIARVVARQIESSIKEYDVELDHIEPEVLYRSVANAAQKNADPREIARIIEKTIDHQIVDLKEQGTKRVRLVDTDDGIVAAPA